MEQTQTVKRIGILVEYNVEYSELIYPLYRFREDGHETFTIGAEAGKVYQCKKGYPIKTDQGIDNIKTEDLDALIIPGGMAPDYWRRDRRFVDLVRDMYNQGKVVAAMCHGPWMFCSAKILQGKKVTGLISIKDDLENAGAVYEDKSVVVDNNMITSRCPSDLPDFCRAIATKLRQ